MRNHPTKGLSFAVFVCTVGILLLVGACSQATDSAQVGQSPTSSLARGEYIVSSVGKCSDCHTPRLKNGAPDQSKLLQGAVLGFAPTVPMPAWEPKSPDIAGGPSGWTRDELVSFLETGKNPKGAFARPPMPAYRLSNSDAQAVADYLLSLKGPDGK